MNTQQQNKVNGVIAKVSKRSGVSIMQLRDETSRQFKDVRGEIFHDLAPILSLKEIAEYFGRTEAYVKKATEMYTDKARKPIENKVAPEKPTFVDLLKLESKKLSEKLAAIQNVLSLYE